MPEFKLKLSKNKNGLVNSKQCEPFKVVMKLKGIYKKNKFSAKVSFKVSVNSNNVQIKDLKIDDVVVKSKCCNKDEYWMSEFNIDDIYNVDLNLSGSCSNSSSCSSSSDESLDSVVYEQIKKFVRNINLSVSNNCVNSMQLSVTNTGICKMKVKGKIC
jgi:hypothetical protein